MEMSHKWNNVREMERGDVPKMEQRSGAEQGIVPEIEQRSRNGTGNCPGNGTMFEKWNRKFTKNTTLGKEVRT